MCVGLTFFLIPSFFQASFVLRILESQEVGCSHGRLMLQYTTNVDYLPDDGRVQLNVEML